MTYDVLTGDVLAVLPTLEAESFDAMLTDPPYGISMMNRAWDIAVPGADVWREALRVLKPGAFALVFGGTRTFHRLAVALEDAGFELRDTLMWIYGSGFPKSLDVSKAIDDLGGVPPETRAFAEAYARIVDASPLSHADIDRALGIKSSSCYWVRTDERRTFPPRKHWERLRALLDIPEAFEEIYAAAERADRVVTIGDSRHVYGAFVRVESAGTPQTPAAARWEGYGTALKPAWEPVLLVRKPTSLTYARNALGHGCGALNIDGARIGSGEESQGARSTHEASAVRRYSEEGATDFAATPGPRGGAPNGRWPANVIHDGSPEVTAAFPIAPGQQGAVGPEHGPKTSVNTYGDYGPRGDFQPRLDTGSAARFFYAAKASTAERDEGLHQFAPQAAGIKNGSGRGYSEGDPYAQVTYRNHHPTVKPLALTEYLARLLLPPERDTPRRILTPFSGSGSEMIGALRAGWDEAIGIEREAEYAEIARARLKRWTRGIQLPLLEAL